MSVAYHPEPTSAALRPQSLPSVKTLKKHRDRLIEAAQRLDDDTLAELCRIATEGGGADGYPASSGGGSSTSSLPEHTTAERAALFGLPGDTKGDTEGDDYGGPDPATVPGMADPILSSVTEICGALSEAYGALRAADRKRQYVLARADAMRGRKPIGGDCLACGEPVLGGVADPIRAGLDGKCDAAWRRWRDALTEAEKATADPMVLRRRFIDWRRERLAEEQTG